PVRPIHLDGSGDFAETSAVPRTLMLLRLSFVAFLALALSGIVSANAPRPDGLDWPQWRGAQRDGVWRETGIREKFEQDTIPLRWSVPIGPGYSGPTVSAGRVYVTDFQ